MVVCDCDVMGVHEGGRKRDMGCVGREGGLGWGISRRGWGCRRVYKIVDMDGEIVLTLLTMLISQQPVGSFCSVGVHIPTYAANCVLIRLGVPARA